MYIFRLIRDWYYQKIANPYKIQPYGICPVQAEGNLPTGEFYYFRARHEKWRLEIYKEESDFVSNKVIFSYSESYGLSRHAAGWMEHYEAIKFTNKTIKIFYKNK